MEEGCSDVVQMTKKSEEAALLLVVPHLEYGTLLQNGDYTADFSDVHIYSNTQCAAVAPRPSTTHPLVWAEQHIQYTVVQDTP